MGVANARSEALAEGIPVRLPLFPFGTHQQSPSKHLHKRSSVRLAWGDLEKLVIFVKNECASSMRRTGTASPDTKWLNRPLEDASSITMLFSIFGSKCSTIGSMHPKWHAGV